MNGDGTKDSGLKIAGIDYETSKRLAGSRDSLERRMVAGRDDTRPEILYLLATDQSADVRREIARNAATPRQADLILSTDPDDGVRSGLAAKIAALAPDLSADAVDQIEKMTLEILETLARDQAVAVRQVLSDTLKDSPSAPPSVIQQLARDLELTVCGPVLRHSPVLTDEDLLHIIQGKPVDGQLVAIAERAGVSSAVTDAVVRTESEAAVAALLANHSAQIREETLDRIVDMAPRHEPWHGPLVRRPKLPAQAAARIAGFVNAQLLKVLEGRTDLPAEARAAVAQAIRQRGTAESADRGSDSLVDDPLPQKGRPSERAEAMHKAGKLDEDAIAGALNQGDRGFVLAALGLKAAIPFATTEKIVQGQSPRAVTALCWKAGLSMRFARQIQLRLAQIPPNNVLNAKSGTDYPLTEAELKWQLEFFGVKV
ncbi:MAG: hypothetical protein RLY86_548 [Pseudomonadota bacterium]|jgi:uncharacterized protein (DUF2336 family)